MCGGDQGFYNKQDLVSYWLVLTGISVMQDPTFIFFQEVCVHQGRRNDFESGGARFLWG